MRSVNTQSISINAAYEKVFNYLSNPLNQKEWAVNFVKEVKPTESGYIALTPMGEQALRIEADQKSGLIDIYFGAEVTPSRLIKNGGACEYIFTIIQPDGMPDLLWEKEGIPGLTEELLGLKTILEY